MDHGEFPKWWRELIGGVTVIGGILGFRKWIRTALSVFWTGLLWHLDREKTIGELTIDLARERRRNKYLESVIGDMEQFSDTQASQARRFLSLRDSYPPSVEATVPDDPSGTIPIPSPSKSPAYD